MVGLACLGGGGGDTYLYCTLVVLMLVKAYACDNGSVFGENVVERVFSGRTPLSGQIRDTPTCCSWAYAALGKAGIEAVQQ